MNITVTNGAIQLDYADSSKTLYKGSVSQINVREFNMLIVSEEENINVPFAMIETINGTTPADMQEVKTIIDANFNSGGATPQTNYSTDETVIGTWIDDKPIYRKVFQISDTNQTINFNPNVNHETIVYNQLNYTNSEIYQNVTTLFSDNILGECYITPTECNIENTNAIPMTNITVILEYTKTTD